ncbi:MAG TPA: hemolysin family protein [Cytophagaceae bacterium]
MAIEIAIIFVLILLNGIFSMSEIALVSSKKFKLEDDAENGSKSAKKALELTKEPGRFLSTIQVGITLIGILTGVYGGASIAETMEDIFLEKGWFVGYEEPVSTGIVVLFITYFTLILGELFPKQLGLSAPERIATFVARPMSVLGKVTQPVVWLLNGSTELLLKIFRIKRKEENQITEDEIKAMLEQASEVEEEEKEMLERVFFLGDTDVGSLMSPRNEMVMLDIDDDIEVNKKIMAESIHTHFPVYEHTTDNIVGILSLKTFSSALMRNEKIELRQLLQPALFVIESTSAFKLLSKMKEKQTHFAIAVNEYGHVKGVVTSNDLFKVIAGNIYSKDDLEIIKRPDGTYLVDALISLDEFFRYFEVEDTEDIEQQGFYTLGGLILYVCGHIPQTGERMTWRNFSFEVVDMDGQRVDKVIVKVTETEINSD